MECEPGLKGTFHFSIRGFESLRQEKFSVLNIEVKFKAKKSE